MPVLSRLFTRRARLWHRILRTTSGRGGVRLPVTQFKKSRTSDVFERSFVLNTVVLFLSFTNIPNCTNASSSFGKHPLEEFCRSFTLSMSLSILKPNNVAILYY